MAFITLSRQETQIRNSDLYDDTIASSEANFETNPTNIEQDLNNLRSLSHLLLKNSAGNWWDGLVTPSTLETGTARGVNDLNDALHAVEKKRVLRCVHNLTDISVPAAASATGVLTATVNFADAETVSVGVRTYTFESTFVPTNSDNIAIGVNLEASLDNLRAAINLDAGAGTAYGSGTTIHPTVSATDTPTTLTVTAKTAGTAGNAIATTDSAANASWGSVTLTGGAGDVVILGTGELPSNTTAAVGAVTTLGTVVAVHGSNFGEHILSEVAGGNAINPLNLLEIVDGSTRDPILSDDRKVYGLLQGESGVTDGVTITDTTATRVQISFVRVTATGDDLEAAPAADVGGATINYCTRERVRYEDLNEYDFLSGAVIDVPPSGATVDLQTAINNQGSTPVDITTDIVLDLEGAGLQWCWRDDLEADLFCITEGSSGGTSEVSIEPDVDTFRVEAVVNDFDNGASFDTGAAGTTINVGVTANQIDSGGALTVASGGSADLNLVGALETNLTDSYRSGSTWSLTDGIALANSSQEWTDFEAAFGEVSLLDAITQAGTSSVVRTKVYATVTATTTADNDVSGPANDNNLDTNLGDLSSGTFVDDYDIYLNGKLLWNGANAGDNKDVYPGTALANGQLRFEATVKVGDVLAVVSWI